MCWRTAAVIYTMLCLRRLLKRTAVGRSRQTHGADFHTLESKKCNCCGITFDIYALQPFFCFNIALFYKAQHASYYHIHHARTHLCRGPGPRGQSAFWKACPTPVSHAGGLRSEAAPSIPRAPPRGRRRAPAAARSPPRHTQPAPRPRQEGSPLIRPYLFYVFLAFIIKES